RALGHDRRVECRRCERRRHRGRSARAGARSQDGRVGPGARNRAPRGSGHVVGTADLPRPLLGPDHRAAALLAHRVRVRAGAVPAAQRERRRDGGGARDAHTPPGGGARRSAGRVHMKHVVLVGAGHTHVAAAAPAVPRLVAAGAEVTLVAPGPFWYSGLATGMLGGGYATALDVIDAGAVVTRGGGRFLRGTVTALVPSERMLVLGSGEQLRYDVLSLDVGSLVPSDALPGAVAYGVLAKPIE